MQNQKGIISLLVILCGIILVGVTSILYFSRSPAPKTTPIPTPIQMDSLSAPSPTPTPIPTSIPTPSPTPVPISIPTSIPKPFVNQNTLDYFLEIAIGSEFGASLNGVSKWDQNPIRIKASGDISPFSTGCLSSVISDFNNLSEKVKLTLSESEADINIYFEPESNFKSIEPNYVPLNHGFFWTWWTPEGKIYKANILINSTSDITDSERCHLIREELTQSMGLKNDSPKYSDSIFYINWTDTNQYSEIDKDVIRLLYSSPVKVGDTKETIRNYFN